MGGREVWPQTDDLAKFLCCAHEVILQAQQKPQLEMRFPHTGVKPNCLAVSENSSLLAIQPLFLAGLMVGRTPEYLGKKIGPAENKMIMLYALAAPLVVLPLTAIAVSTRLGLSGLTVNTGPHGFTGILFA